MEFGKAKRIQPLPLTADLPDKLYPPMEGDAPVDFHKDVLRDIVRFLSPIIGTFPEGYTLIVLQEAMDAFHQYGDAVYDKYHTEATGLMLGYYLHAPGNPAVRVGIATTFIEARGVASSVRCEVSHEDCCQANLYAEQHHLLFIVWPHTHPGFGVFYSDTDSTTLRTDFSAEQHAGIVIDNLKGRYLAYKIIDGRQEKIPIWSFSLNDFRSLGMASLFQYLEDPVQEKETGEDACTDVQEPEETPPGADAGNAAPAPSPEGPLPAERDEILDRLSSIASSLETIVSILEKREAVALSQDRAVACSRDHGISFPGFLIFAALTFCYTLAMIYL